MASIVAFWQTLSADPYTLAAVAVLVISLGALALLIALPGRRRTASSARGERSARVRSLAKSGAAPIEIARSTGLSHDAIAILLGAGAKTGRKSRPASAGIAQRTGASAPTAQRVVTA